MEEEASSGRGRRSHRVVPLCKQLGDPGDTNRTFGPGEHGVREEKQSREKTTEKAAPLCVTCKGLRVPSGKDLRLRDTCCFERAHEKGTGQLGQRKQHKVLWRSRLERTVGQACGTYPVGKSQRGSCSHLSLWNHVLGTHPACRGHCVAGDLAVSEARGIAPNSLGCIGWMRARQMWEGWIMDVRGL